MTEREKREIERKQMYGQRVLFSSAYAPALENATQRQKEKENDRVECETWRGAEREINNKRP